MHKLTLANTLNNDWVKVSLLVQLILSVRERNNVEFAKQETYLGKLNLLGHTRRCYPPRLRLREFFFIHLLNNLLPSLCKYFHEDYFLASSGYPNNFPRRINVYRRNFKSTQRVQYFVVCTDRFNAPVSLRSTTWR